MLVPLELKNMRKGIKKHRDVRRIFQHELKSILKIRDISDFREAFSTKLKNPIFQSNILFNKSNFRSGGFGVGGNFPSSKLDQIILVLLIKMKKEANLLTYYTDKKEQYDKFILDGNYQRAFDIVEAVGEASGFSIWYIEAKLSTLSLLNDIDGMKNFYDKTSNANLNEIERRDLDLIFDRASPTSKVERITYSLDALKSGLSAEDLIDSYIIDFMHRFDCGERYNSEKILSYFWQSNIIDIYNCFLRLVLTNSFDFKEIDESIFRSFKDLAIVINDKKALNYIGVKDKTFIDNTEKYLEICDIYIKGDYKSFIDSYNLHFSDKSEIFSLYELLVNCNYNEQNQKKENHGSVFSILTSSISPTSIENRLKIKKYFLMLNHIDALQTYSLKEAKRIIGFDRSKIERIYSYFDCTSFPNNPFNIKTSIEGNISSLVTHSNAEQISKLPIPQYRIKKVNGDNHFYNKRFREACLDYLSITDAPRHMKDEIYNKIILCYFHDSKISDACNFICDLFFSNCLNIDRLDAQKILRLLEECDPPEYVSIEIPIAIYLISSQIGDYHKTSLYLDDYLDSLGIKLPSQIEPNNEKSIFLMHKVCNLDVLESLHTIRKIYQSSSERLLDRTRILRNIESDNNQEILNEIKFLSTQFARNLCIKDIGKGKINLNFEMISEIIKETQPEYITSLKNEYDKLNNVSFSDIERLSIDKNSAIYSATYEFLSIVRDVYTLDGKYGLDYQLNTKIRHNGIVPAIRSIFEAEGVLSNKVDGNYIDNEKFEHECKPLLWDSIYKNCQEKIKSFSKHIDVRLSRLKNVYMQIMTNDKNEEDRLFKFTITEQDVSKFIILFNSENTAENFIYQAIEILKLKTKQSLHVGKTLISEALKDDFKSQIIELKNHLKTINTSTYKSSLSIIYNKLDTAMSEIGEWLNFSEVIGENFNINVALLEAENFTKNIFPKVEVRFNAENDFNKIFNGKHLDSFVNMFILLFENATKNRDDVDLAHINIKISQGLEDQLDILISNNSLDIDQAVIEKINNEINTQAFINKANKEKSSGLFKVKKILEIDFQCKNTIKLEQKNGVFYFRATIDASLLIVRDNNE